MSKQTTVSLLVTIAFLMLVLSGILLLMNHYKIEQTTEVPPVTETVLEAVETEEPEVRQLTGILETAMENVPLSRGNWDIYLEDGGSGESAGYSDTGAPMVSASLIKLFIMGAVYQEADGSDDLPENLRNEIEKMITVSDNEAANTLVLWLGNGNAAAGMEKVNAFARDIGCTDTQQNRLMLEDNGLQNYTSAADCGKMLSLLCSGNCVNADASEAMMKHLEGQQVTNGLADLLPEGTVCAHKTGNLLNLVVGDVGVIKSENSTWILCMICNNQEDELSPQESIRSFSLEVYRQMTIPG